MVQEIWKPISGFPGYEVSDHGRVRSYKLRGRGGLAITPQRILQPHQHDQKHYPQVNLYHKGKGFARKIHRLVLQAFIGPCPEGFEACHNDHNRLNNHLSNLRYDTRSNNSHDSVGHTIGRLTVDEVLAIRQAVALGKSDGELALQYNISKDIVFRCRSGHSYRHIGGPRTKYKGGGSPGYAVAESAIVSMRQERHEGAFLKELAAKYDISESGVSRIVRGLRNAYMGGPISPGRFP